MSDIAAGELRRSRLRLKSASRRSPMPVFRALFHFEPHPDGATDWALGFVRPDREAEIGDSERRLTDAEPELLIDELAQIEVQERIAALIRTSASSAPTSAADLRALPMWRRAC